jgi:hypothetical protein
MMKLMQISLFVENKPGSMTKPARILAEAGIDISTLMLADSKDYGILRLLTRDWEKAKAVLEKAAITVKVTEVLAVEIEDRPGGLVKIFEILERLGLNVAYMYAFTESRGDKAVVIFRFENPDAAIAALSKEGVGLVEAPKLFA